MRLGTYAQQQYDAAWNEADDRRLAHRAEQRNLLAEVKAGLRCTLASARAYRMGEPTPADAPIYAWGDDQVFRWRCYWGTMHNAQSARRTALAIFFSLRR